MRKVSRHEKKLANKAVAEHNIGDALGKNKKYLEDGKIIQIKIGATLRVRFCSITREIISIFHKDNHRSHR